MNNSRCWSDTLPLSMQVLMVCTNFTVKVVETEEKQGKLASQNRQN